MPSRNRVILGVGRQYDNFLLLNTKMSHKKEMIDTLIESSKSIDVFYVLDDGLYEVSGRFETWVEQVANALEAANMTEELEKWEKAKDIMMFSPGGSSFFEIDEANFKNDLRAMRAILLGIRDRLDVAQVEQTPFLSNSDITNARKMSELYIVLYCYENSVRYLIKKVLTDAHGENWWEQVASDAMKRSVESLKNTEQKKRWLPPRGQTSPLYYLEWGDLVKLIRKEEKFFLTHIGSLKFVESRFEELESLRHIVAHNGTLPSDEDFHRVTIWFRDWCRQIGRSDLA